MARPSKTSLFAVESLATVRKKIILAIFFGIIFYLLYSLFFRNTNVNFIAPTPTPTPSISGDVKGISFENESFNYHFVEATPINLHLFLNLSDKLTAEDARIKNNCEFLVNAGFYTKEERPIGLFVSDFEKISNATNSNLFNGFFTVDSQNNANINTNPPSTTPRIGLQSGPILILNGKAKTINSINNERARRVVLEKTANGNLIFIVIFKKDNFSNGPLLKNLPEIVSLINEDISKNIISAINLDGGSHSAFITNDVSINEISTIGSYFCIR